MCMSWERKKKQQKIIIIVFASRRVLIYGILLAGMFGWLIITYNRKKSLNIYSI